ncbi:MAG: fumarate hydratase C-terminal domain-containing protein [Clostridia bacterium]|nr:fumarate hydratase C-terminal domain-containing protein [Clostridia bacterium]
MKTLVSPFDKKDLAELTAGQTVFISGVLYTARDEAHKRVCEYVRSNKPLPFDLKGATIYYAGPCPAKEGKACGSCGPTTSARMNKYAPALFDLGLTAAIGKGEMSEEVIKAIKRNNACYFAAIGGAGALYGDRIKKCDLVAFPDLLSEGVYRLEVENFPAVVAIDSNGNSIYKNF